MSTLFRVIKYINSLDRLEYEALKKDAQKKKPPAGTNSGKGLFHGDE